MAWSQAKLDAIEDAIAQGVLTVSFSAAGTTKTVTYRSLGEMKAARDMIRRGLGLTQPGSTRKYLTVSKGTDRCSGNDSGDCD